MRNPLSPVSESVHDFINRFMSAYGETKDKILEELYPGLLKDTVDAVAEVGGDITAIGSLVRKFYEIISIPDKIFMGKVEHYLNGIAQIPVDKRQKYIEKTAREMWEEEAVFTLSILNRSEEMSKINIFVRLFAAKVNGEVDDIGYRRFMRLADRTLYSDIIFVRGNICHGELSLSTDQLQSLSADGWLKYAGMTLLSFEKAETDSNAYEYTTLAKQFCKIVFNTDIDARPHADSIQHIELEEIGGPQSDPLTE